MVIDAKTQLVFVNRKPVDFAKLPAGVAFVASLEKVSGTVQTQEVCRFQKARGLYGC
jgi:inositol transport system substrate-binding protein